MHSSPGASEKLATQTANEDISRRKDIDTHVDTDLGEFEGAPGTSPFYRSQVTSGTEDVAAAHRSSRANTRMQARAAGFGYEQPMVQGAEAEDSAQEAHDTAEVPRQALINEAGMKLQAAGLREGEMGQFNPNASIATAGKLEQDRLNRRAMIFQSLAKLGMAGATMGMTAAGVGGYGNN